MSTEQLQIGVSGIAIAVPPCRVELERWCEWYGQSWPKTKAVIGHSFRVASPWENVYTMAANAVLKLILTYDVDPNRVGLLALGTESSTDNSAGAVIVRGMVDRALEQLGHPRLSRFCEVPELKHACLGGIYAQKAALRYLAADGAGRQAIVVAADIAEYERGSSGEPTQGAGAVALLLERDPQLYAIDLHRSGSASSYRGIDFRKPLRRYVMGGLATGATKLHDFPVFNGKYSTTCYIDQTIWALEDLCQRLAMDPHALYDQVAAMFFHRPYHWMPRSAMAVLYVVALARASQHHHELTALCALAGVSGDDVLDEVGRMPDLFEQALRGQHNDEAYPVTMQVAKALRKTAQHDRLEAKMQLGAELMKELGNLYTAALPAWIAAGLEDALEQGEELAGKALLAVGYGSGDAAEAYILTVVPGWQAAARRIGLRAALEHGSELSREAYEQLHDGQLDPALNPELRGFVIERTGNRTDAALQDLGIDYFRYIGGQPTATLHREHDDATL